MKNEMEVQEFIEKMSLHSQLVAGWRHLLKVIDQAGLNTMSAIPVEDNLFTTRVGPGAIEIIKAYARSQIAKAEQDLQLLQKGRFLPAEKEADKPLKLEKPVKIKKELAPDTEAPTAPENSGEAERE